MAKILVTGATGFVGKQLVPALIEAGHEVRCAVTQQRPWLRVEQVLTPKLEENPDWHDTLAGIEVVIHLAARVHVLRETDPAAGNQYKTVNSLATKKLAEQAVAHGVRRFIFLSTIKVHGEFTLSEPFTEKSAPVPEDLYGQSKLLAEHYLQEIAQKSSLEVVILRPPLIYGPDVKANFLKMMQLVNKGFPLPFGRVNNQRHLLYVDNLVSAILMVIGHPAAANQTYLLADDESLSLPQMMRILAQEMQVKLKLLPVPLSLMRAVFTLLRKPGLITRLFSSLEISNHKIKQELQWMPPVSTNEGLKKTAQWYQREFIN